MLYFSDHLSEYLLSLLPAEELRGLFSVYDHALEPQSKNSILRMVGALQKNDFNLVRSSEALFLHKNTLVSASTSCGRRWASTPSSPPATGCC